MHRRRFLTILPFGVALLARPGKLLSALKAPPRLRFHVAGVKFQETDPTNFESGMKVELRRGQFEGETCFSVHAGGHRLGFVPRRLIRQVEAREVRAAYLSDSPMGPE